MTPRQQGAFAIRDAVMIKLRQEGSFKEIKNMGPMLGWECTYRGDGSLEILYRTPFQVLPEPSATTIRRAALEGFIIPSDINFPYGLDIWVGKKVFNLEWHDDGRFKIINFTRGEWEKTVLSWAE